MLFVIFGIGFCRIDELTEVYFGVEDSKSEGKVYMV